MLHVVLQENLKRLCKLLDSPIKVSFGSYIYCVDFAV